MMRSKRRNLMAIGATLLVGIALAVAACGGDDDDDDNGDATAVSTQPAASASPTAAASTQVPTESADETPADGAPAGGATVQAAATGLVDSRGLSLYLFANDTAGSGESACSGQCLTVWPALTVTAEPTAGEGVGGELGTITRDDGSTQVTYNGLPLYFFASDVAPGDTNGASIPNWSLAQP